jgi:hypothetical protein
MNWTSVNTSLPESGERVLVYWYESHDLHQMHVIEYYKAGDVVFDEVIYQGNTPLERLKDAIFGTRGQRTIEQDGFYIYDPDIETGLCKWRRHNDCITHWARLPAPPETEDKPCD